MKYRHCVLKRSNLHWNFLKTWFELENAKTKVLFFALNLKVEIMVFVTKVLQIFTNSPSHKFTFQSDHQYLSTCNFLFSQWQFNIHVYCGNLSKKVKIQIPSPRLCSFNCDSLQLRLEKHKKKQKENIFIVSWQSRPTKCQTTRG